MKPIFDFHCFLEYIPQRSFCWIEALTDVRNIQSLKRGESPTINLSQTQSLDLEIKFQGNIVIVSIHTENQDFFCCPGHSLFISAAEKGFSILFFLLLHFLSGSSRVRPSEWERRRPQDPGLAPCGDASNCSLSGCCWQALQSFLCRVFVGQAF